MQRNPYQEKYEKSEHGKAVRLANREKKRAVVREAKNKPCADCDGRFHPRVMHLHHLGDKSFAFGKTSVGLPRLRAELAKCIVLCANCHMERHAYGEAV